MFCPVVLSLAAVWLSCGGGAPPADSAADNEGEGEGEGEPSCSPRLTVVPALCDFGDVGVGDTGLCDLAISGGACDLLVENLEFTSETPFPLIFGPASTISIPTLVPANGTTHFQLYAKPQDASVSTGTFVIDGLGRGSTDPQVEVLLSVRGRAP
jgi:hypothetical protein